MKPALAIVAAVADNGVIGRDNRLIWRLKSDLRRFRDLTWGKPMIMGRKTFESIGKALPGRKSIVLTRDPTFAAPEIAVAHSWTEAVALGETAADEMEAREVAVIGGAEIYALALPETTRLYLSLVHAEPQGDTFFPAYDKTAFRQIRRSERPKGPDDDHPFTLLDLERRRNAASR